MAAALDLLEVHDRPRVIEVEGIRGQALSEVARGEHGQDGKQARRDLLIVLAVVAEHADLVVDHALVLVLRDLLLVVGDVGDQLRAGDLRGPPQLPAARLLQQLSHLDRVAPAPRQDAIEEVREGGLQHGLHAAGDVLDELDQVGPVLQADQPLDHDVDGVPPEGTEGPVLVGRHDRLKAARDLGGLLPVEGEVEANTDFREGRVELEEGVGLAIVLARPLDDALEPAAVLGVDEHDDVAALDGLGQQRGQCDALAGLCGTDQQGATFEVLQRSVQRLFLGLHAVDEGHADLRIGLRIDGVAQQREQRGRQRVLLVVDLGQLVEALGVQRLPLEAEAEKHHARIGRELVEASSGDDLHRPSGQRGPHRQDPRCLTGAHDHHQHREGRER